MAHCLNHKHPEIQELAQKTGLHPAIVAAKAAIWQEKNNTLDRFPTSEELRSSNQVNYSLKAVDILISDKAKQVFEKGIKNNWPLDKILTELQVPKEQKQIILDRGHKILTHNDARLSNEPDLREQIITDLLANYSYTVEINIAKEKGKDYIMVDNGDGNFEPNPIEPEFDYEEVLDEEGNVIDMQPVLTEKGKKQIADMEDIKPTQYYSNLTVPGGTNYTENEIATPLITPSIKGHAQFATDNGIGWFRSDEQLVGGEFKTNNNNPLRGWDTIEGENAFAKTEGGTATKTRRILEVQSDLFQKGRDKEFLVDNYKHTPGDRNFNVTYEGKEYKVGTMGGMQRVVIYKTLEGQVHYQNPKQDWLTQEEIPQGLKDIVSNKFNSLKQEVLTQNKSNKENQFLQLLNKDNNWVTFFVKSIIQDSAKKGYEKVLFPSGNTASKVEGHTTLEEFKKQKEDRIKFLDGEINDPENIERRIEEAKREREQIKQELERVETEGFGALKPIFNFYETTVTNILKKTYPVNQVTDEYGNTWNEVTLDKASDLLLQTKDSSKSILEKALPELDKYLLDFLKDFGVKSKEFEDLKSKLGIDALGATDVLNKLIWYVKDRNIETIPEEAGHMIVMLMGENNILISELLDNIENWSEFREISSQYTPIYKNEKQVRIEAVGKLLAKALVKNYKAVGINKNLIEKVLGALRDLLLSIATKFNFGAAMHLNEHIADKIALNILAGNKNFVANLEAINPKVDYQKALDSNSLAKAVINTFTSNKYNAKLTGSIAIAAQNEHVYRPAETPIHDIDFTVNSIEDYNKILKTLEEIKAEPAHYGWSNAQKNYDTFAWYIPAPGYRVNILERDYQRGNGWVTKYELYDIHNNLVEATPTNLVVVDFFVNKHGKKNSDSIFSSVNDIYFGKLTLSPLGDNERMFIREKDQQDYVLHKPKSISNVRPEFVYYQLNADVKKAIDPKLEAAVDKVIDNLVQRIEELKTIAGGSTNQSTRINIARLQTKLAELSEERTYEKLADIALYQLNEASRILALDTPSAFELNEVKRILIYTENFDSYLTEGGKDFKAVKDLIREKNVTSNVIFQEKLLDAAFAHSKITGVEYSREELNKAQKDEFKLAAQTLSPEYSSVNLAKIIGRAIVLANRKTQEDFSNNFIDPLAELLRALDKKKFETSDFNEVMEDGKLILEFTNEFFEHESNMWRKHYELLQDYKKDTKLGAQIKASFEDIFTWYKDNLDYYVTPETRKKYEQDLADFKKANLDANGKETAKTAEAVRKWQAVNSPYLMLKRTEDEDGNQTIESDPDGKVFIDAKIVWTTQIGDKYYKNTNWHKYLKARPKKKYKNSKWDKASANPLHKFMLEKYVEAMKMLPRKVAVDTENYHRFLNEFSLDVTQSENRLKNLYSGIGNIARETFTVQVNQAMLDGGVIKKIVNPDGSITEEFQPFLRSKDEKGNTKPHIKHKTIEDLKKREKFRDPLEILQEFFKQAVTYNHRVEAAPMLDLLQYKIENLPGISTNMINAILLDAHRNPEIIENGLVNTAAQTRYAINAFKSGITRMDTDLGTIITDKQKAKLRELTEAWVAGGMQGPAPTISPISGVKVSDALVDYTRMSLIGLKPFTAATNLLLGLMSNYVYAARGKEFTEKHLDQASRLLFGNVLKFISRKRILTSDTKKTANLSEKMGITDTLYETKDPDVAIQAKNKFVKFVYALQEGGEFLIANQTMIAMMLNTKITSKDGVESNLWEATNEDGNLKPEFQTKEWTSVEVIDDKGDNISKLNAFRNSLDKIRKRTQGDYQSPMAAKGEWYFRHLMMFRTWIPQALRERWGKEDEDFKGRYRSYGAMFTKSFKTAGFRGFLETTGRFGLATIAKMTNILPLGKYRFDKLDISAKESFDKYLDKIGASELDIENMRANIKELQFLLTMSIVALGLIGLKGDDDDDKTLNFLINIMHRLNADLTAFIWPKSALSIIKDPFPVMKTIKDVIDVLQAGSDYIENPESRYYKKGYNKGDLKFFEELQDLLPIYSAINSTQGTLNTVFNSESYKYAK